MLDKVRHVASMRSISPKSLAQLHAENPDMKDTTSVSVTTMDKVYEYATTPREQTDMLGVVLRFVPDVEEVQAAIQVRARGNNCGPTPD